MHKPSPNEKLFFFISGVIVSVPFTLFFSQLSNYVCVVLPIYYANLCSIAVITPFVEEFAKAYPLFYRHGESERSIFHLGFFVGLGFGLSEFILYVFVLEAPLLIRLPLLFFHAASTSITSYGIAKKRLLQFYFLAVFLHFSNNFFAIFKAPIPNVGGPFVVALTFILTYILYQRTSEKVIL